MRSSQARRRSAGRPSVVSFVDVFVDLFVDLFVDPCGAPPAVRFVARSVVPMEAGITLGLASRGVVTTAS
jgi:hypothetical protein